GILQPVFHVPDLLGNGGGETAHGRVLQGRGKGTKIVRPTPGGNVGPPLAKAPRTATYGAMALHILKLCVGCDSVEDLADWQRQRAAELPGGLPRHVTRMWPKRADEVLAGGSLYWIIKGQVLVR